MSYFGAATRLTLSALHYSGVARMLAPLSQGVGAIFMLHHVSNEPVRDFDPNAFLRVTPRFLQEMIDLVRESGMDVVSLDEAHRRLSQPGTQRRFACFTLDDGYRDNLEHAYPVFAANHVPFTIYIPSDYADGKADLWWLALEHVVRVSARLCVRAPGFERDLDCSDAPAKTQAFNAIYWWLRTLPEAEARLWVRERCREAGFDAHALAASLLMSWEEIRTLMRDPLCTIGAHTRSHMALGRLSAEDARAEIEDGCRRLEEMLGVRPAHFSFPYGDRASATPRDFEIARSLGFKTSVTTRKGLLFPQHADHLHALPRLSVNGSYQCKSYSACLMTGVPFLLFNGLRRVVTA